MTEKIESALKRPPESNAAFVARCLVYSNVDLDGSGMVQLLSLLQARAEQIRLLNQKMSEMDRKVESGEITDQAEYNASVLDGLYETTCMKWFLASALRELAGRLESEVYGAQIRLNPIRHVTYSADGQVESFLLDASYVEPNGANI